MWRYYRVCYDTNHRLFADGVETVDVDTELHLRWSFYKHMHDSVRPASRTHSTAIMALFCDVWTSVIVSDDHKCAATVRDAVFCWITCDAVVGAAREPAELPKHVARFAIAFRDHKTTQNLIAVQNQLRTETNTQLRKKDGVTQLLILVGLRWLFRGEGATASHSDAMMHGLTDCPNETYAYFCKLYCVRVRSNPCIHFHNSVYAAVC